MNNLFLISGLYLGNLAYTLGSEINVVNNVLKNTTLWWSELDYNILLIFSSGFYALGSVMAGYLSDKIGGNYVFVGGLFLSGVFNIITIAWNQNSIYILVCQALNILVGAAAWPSMVNMVANKIEMKYLAIVFSLLSTSDELGEYLSRNIDDSLGSNWRVIFVIHGILVLILSFILLPLIKCKIMSNESQPRNQTQIVTKSWLEAYQTEIERKQFLEEPLEEVIHLPEAEDLRSTRPEFNFHRKYHFWFMISAVVSLTVISEVSDWFPDNASKWSNIGSFVALFGGIFYGIITWKTEIILMTSLNVMTFLSLIFLTLYLQIQAINETYLVLICLFYGLVSAIPSYMPLCIYVIRYGGKYYAATLYGIFDGLGYFVSLAFNICMIIDWRIGMGLALISSLLATILIFSYSYLTRPREYVINYN